MAATSTAMGRLSFIGDASLGELFLVEVFPPPARLGGRPLCGLQPPSARDQVPLTAPLPASCCTERVSPTGSQSRWVVRFAVMANDAYQAHAAVAMPNAPPMWNSTLESSALPSPSSTYAGHRVRNTIWTAMFTRNEMSHM